MMPEEKEEIALREYDQVAQQIRSYSVQLRWSVTSSATISFGLFTVAASKFTDSISHIMLLIIGLIISCVSWLVIGRLRVFINSYTDRAIEIENELGMNAFKSAKEKGDEICPRISNTRYFQIISGLFFLLFLVALLLEVIEVICKHHG